MTRLELEGQLSRLSGLRFAPADSETHWEALYDMPLGVLTAAVSRAQKTRSDFPTPLELRQDADQVAHHVAVLEPLEDRSTELVEPITFTIPVVDHPLRFSREWSYHCDDCNDSGMRGYWCGDEPKEHPKPWLTLRRCDRRSVHGTHDWVDRCQCFDTNPAVQRRLEQQRKYADSGAQKR